ncbi:molybdopterin converting factor subunit 1 [Aromatoleum toluvorans]|uniref:Molybdopterin converting factor subunit 1 n=1 Tax=Aromatoleum toluvorans TaxID=92002 RepID=A0ABX1PXY4_9RHOO|nr:molybdopterin converting factor subunit 1 [Aromatoleum toluvorans]NMG44003.1 molybdopterin converting factor subunit 1 [Aromatoleum toluvorans]
MTVKILYFASLKEALGCAGEDFVLPSGVSTIGELRTFLAGRGEPWNALGEGRNIRAARNQRMAAPADPVLPGDEIAFFPPVTGG